MRNHQMFFKALGIEQIPDNKEGILNFSKRLNGEKKIEKAQSNTQNIVYYVDKMNQEIQSFLQKKI